MADGDVVPVYEGIGGAAPGTPSHSFGDVGAAAPQSLSPDEQARQSLALYQRYHLYDSADLIDQAIGARRAVENRRNDLINQLGSAGRRDVPRIGAQLNALEQDQHQQDFEANQRRIQAHTDALELHHQLATDRNTAIDEQGAALMQSMGYLDSKLRTGEISKQQYDDALLQAGQQFPMGLRHPEAAKHYDFAIDQADRLNAFTARRDLAAATQLGARYGIGPQVDPETGMPSIEATRQAALQTDKGRLETLDAMSREMKAKYGVGTGVSSLFNPITPHTDTSDGTGINLPFIGKDGKVSSIPVPKPLFNQMKADFNDRYFQTVPQAAPQAAQPAQGGLQAGVTRNVGGKNYQWSGTKWEPQ